MADRSASLVHPNYGEHPIICKHPAVYTEWERDDIALRWVGICRNCGIGRAVRYGDEPIVRTDEQIARGLVPDVPAIDRFLATPYLSRTPWWDPAAKLAAHCG